MPKVESRRFWAASAEGSALPAELDSRREPAALPAAVKVKVRLSR